MCPAGKFARASATVCAPTTCPKGISSAPGAVSASDCALACPAGKFGSPCVACPGGKYLSLEMSVGGAHTCKTPAAAKADCAADADALTYAPAPGSACTEKCAAYLGGGGTRLFSVSGVAAACADFATARLPCNVQPCDPDLITPESFAADDPYPVLNQGHCGACWAFAAAQVYGARARSALGGRLPSPQWLLECSGGRANALCAAKRGLGVGDVDCGHSCDGGFAIMAFEYMNWRGVATCSADAAGGCVPFVSKGGGAAGACPTVPGEGGEAQCSAGAPQPTEALVRPLHAGHCFTYNSAGWTPYLQYGIRRELFVNGLVSATMHVCESFFEQFGAHTSSGANASASAIYDQSCDPDSADFAGRHEVVLAGWGADNATHAPYWLVKNSWGARWNGDGYFKIKRGENTAGIEGSVCMINPATEVLKPHYHHNPRAIWTLIGCGFANNDTNQPISAPSTQCDLGATHKAGGWTTNRRDHPAVLKAARHALAHGSRRALRALATNGSDMQVLAAQSQAVAGVKRRVLMSVGGSIVEAVVEHDTDGQHSLLAEPVVHSCEPASCTERNRNCCTKAQQSGAECGACIAASMMKELEEVPPAPPTTEMQAWADGLAQGQAKGLAEGELAGSAEGMSEGVGEGALLGSAVTLASVVAAQLLWNRARRARAQQQSWSQNVEVGAPAQAL